MIKRVLVIGGYGNFGKIITTNLSCDDNLQLIIVGRSATRAQKLAQSLPAIHPVEIITDDIMLHTDAILERAKPDIVIHTSGPFQGQSYKVAESCIRQRCHYIDLADGRDFVSNITQLDTVAKDAGVLLVSGASSVPALTSAIIDTYKPSFQAIETFDSAILSAQKTMVGLATVKGVLSYAGKPIRTLINGTWKTVYGWQDLHAYRFPQMGWRALGNCEIPDLTLFPKYYPELKTIRFYAGAELIPIHLVLWLMTGLVRLKLIRSLADWAEPLLKLSRLVDWLGSDKSAFYARLHGIGHDNKKKKVIFSIIADKGEGLQIPCIPSTLLVRALAAGTLTKTGAMPCIGLISLSDYFNAMKPYRITCYTPD